MTFTAYSEGKEDFFDSTRAAYIDHGCRMWYILLMLLCFSFHLSFVIVFVLFVFSIRVKKPKSCLFIHRIVVVVVVLIERSAEICIEIKILFVLCFSSFLLFCVFVFTPIVFVVLVMNVRTAHYLSRRQFLCHLNRQ